MKKLYLLNLSILIFATLVLKSQDQNYSQFFNNRLYYNPAYAGLYNGVRASFNYRKQWTNIPYDFNSYNVSLDMAVRNLPGAGGVGLIFHHNNEGTGMIKNVYAGIVLSARIYPAENYTIQFGITTAVSQRSINWDGLVFPDQLDSKYGNIYSTGFTEPFRGSVVYPDFNFGSVLNYTSESMNARIGGSISHIFQPKIGFVETESQLYMKFVAHADALIFINGSSNRRDRRSAGSAKINPGFLYENQNGDNTFSFGINGYKSFVYLGVWFRNEDFNTTNLSTMVYLAGVNFPINDDSRIKIMYSYDYVMNGISIGSSHEISVIFEFQNSNVMGAAAPGGHRKNWGAESCSPF